MRRALRLSALLLAVALTAAACAEPTTEAQALLDDAYESALDDTLALDGPVVDDDDLSAEDFDEDEPWLPDDVATDDGVVAREGPRPEIRQFRCPFPRDGLSEARCGTIELPGRGDDPRFTVELSFVRFSATGEEADKRPDPVVFLHGGPGGAVIDTADHWYESIVRPHVETRDVILYDQRGAGRSTPLPSCRETSSTSKRFYDEVVAHEALRDDFLAALHECAQRLDERDDVDLTAFDSSVNAQDLVDLMWALGIDEYNIHGSSYGTRLAQTLLRDSPEGVRSVVLSGAYPIEENLMGSVPASLESSLDAVFAGCAASPACAEALPDPWRTLEDLVRELDRTPLAVETPVSATISLPLAFDGTDLLNGLHSLLYVSYHAATVPDLLIDWLDGDVRRLERLARVSLFDHTDVAIFILVQCADEGAFTTDDHLRRPLDHEFLRAVDVAPSLSGLDATTICDVWPTGSTDPIENEPVTWDAPTLLLSGALDPITPPEWAMNMAERLPRSRLAVFAGLSHDSDEGWCSTDLIAEFVEHPAVLLDMSCAAYDADLVVNENAERFGEQLALVDRSHDFDDDGEYVEFEGPNWVADRADGAQILWRALDQLDGTALLLLGPGSVYEAADHLVFAGPTPDWEDAPHADVPDGWARRTMTTRAGTLVGYTHETTRVELVLVIEAGEPDDLETTVLRPVAASIGAGT